MRVCWRRQKPSQTAVLGESISARPSLNLTVSEIFDRGSKIAAIGLSVEKAMDVAHVPLLIERLKRLFTVPVRLQRSCKRSIMLIRYNLNACTPWNIPSRVAEWQVSNIPCWEVSSDEV
jgi:hypothetical protein